MGPRSLARSLSWRLRALSRTSSTIILITPTQPTSTVHGRGKISHCHRVFVEMGSYAQRSEWKHICTYTWQEEDELMLRLHRSPSVVEGNFRPHKQREVRHPKTSTRHTGGVASHHIASHCIVAFLERTHTHMHTRTPISCYQDKHEEASQPHHLQESSSRQEARPAINTTITRVNKLCLGNEPNTYIP